MEYDPHSPPPGFWSALGRGLIGRCPRCGQGRLFARYLKPVEACAVCAEPYGHIRADDGPAWLTILVLGHFLTTILLWVVPNSTWPEWVSLVVWVSVAIVLIPIILPRAKGLFIAILWRTKSAGSEKA